MLMYSQKLISDVQSMLVHSTKISTTVQNNSTNAFTAFTAFCISVILITLFILIKLMSLMLRVSNDVTLSLNTARQHGIEKCVEKMLNFAEQLRRLKVGLQMLSYEMSSHMILHLYFTHTLDLRIWTQLIF